MQFSFQTCTINNSSLIYCLSPAVRKKSAEYLDLPSTRSENASVPKEINVRTDLEERRRRRQPSTWEAQLGFYMDNVLSVQNLSASFPGVPSTLDYTTDPIIFDFEEADKTKTYSQGIVLAIKV